MRQKSLPQEDKHKLEQLEKKLLATAETLKLNMKDVRPSKRKVVAKCFNLVGISVPCDKKTDVGYRPLTVTNSKWCCTAVQLNAIHVHVDDFINPSALR